EHGPARQRPEGEGPDEVLRVARQADRHAGARGRQLAQEQHGLVGRDGPGDAEDDLPPVEPRHVQAFVSSTSFTRYSILEPAISSIEVLVGFLCRVSTRAAAPRLSCRARLAASTTSK